MNLQDCQRILQVSAGASLDEVKASFRRLAFSLHPDLNPAPDAAAKFRQLNEAYVLLTRSLQDEALRNPGQAKARQEAADSRARKAQAGKAYAKGAQGSPEAGAKPGAKPGPKPRHDGARFEFREEEVLRDLLSDPFARQVFEDIYSQLKNGTSSQARQGFQPSPSTGGTGWSPAAKAAKPVKRRRLELTWGDKSLGIDLGKGLVGGVKSWLRSQLDDEQTVSYPAYALGPGKSLRISITSRFGEPRTVEITLPKDFVVGRPVRLKGLGSKLGPFTGDLFLRILAK